MGAALSIFGKINEESPHFSLLKKTAEYEIRRYAQAIAVETSYEAVRLFANVNAECENPDSRRYLYTIKFTSSEVRLIFIYIYRSSLSSSRESFI